MSMTNKKKEKNTMSYIAKTKSVKISTIRDLTYKKINELTADIKKNTEMSDHFIEKVDINMKNAINKILNDYKVNDNDISFSKDFVMSDSYTVIEPGLSEFNLDQSITHNELLDYMKRVKDYKLESINVLPELTQ